MRTFASLFEEYKKYVRIWKIRGKIWAKKLREIDETLSNGYAFKGDFLEISKEKMTVNDISDGDVLIISVDEGSAKYHAAHVIFLKVLKVTKNDVETELLVEVKGYDWAKQILSDDELLSKIKRALNQEVNVLKLKLKELLEDYSFEEIIKTLEELKEQK